MVVEAKTKEKSWIQKSLSRLQVGYSWPKNSFTHSYNFLNIHRGTAQVEGSQPLPSDMKMSKQHWLDI